MRFWSELCCRQATSFMFLIGTAHLDLPRSQPVLSFTHRGWVGFINSHYATAPTSQIAANRRLAYEIVRRRSGGANRTPDPNNPVLVLQQAVPCGDAQNRLSVLLAPVSQSTTSTNRPVPSDLRVVSNGVKIQRKSRTAIRPQKTSHETRFVTTDWPSNICSYRAKRVWKSTRGRGGTGRRKGLKISRRH
jgi:hypothetical protein